MQNSWQPVPSIGSISKNLYINLNEKILRHVIEGFLLLWELLFSLTPARALVNASHLI